MRTLLLDKTYFPVKVVDWQKAIILLLTGRAEVVCDYEDKQIRSSSCSYNLPKILRLYNRHKAPKRVRFTRYNVYHRDNFTCQYCYQKFSANELTFDHVFPVSRGGKTTWENVVTSCAECNVRKGSKTPKEANLKLLKEPKRPKWTPELVLKLKINDPLEWWDWFPKISPVAS